MIETIPNNLAVSVKGLPRPRFVMRFGQASKKYNMHELDVEILSHKDRKTNFFRPDAPGFCQCWDAEKWDFSTSSGYVSAWRGRCG